MNPNCKCHNKPMSWAKDPRYSSGGYWRCRVTRSEINKRMDKKGNGAYKSWHMMKQRCLNSNRSDYKFYGGRGISICDRWINSFENFWEDMGDRPDGMSLDRIDNDGNYEPNNCKWSNQSEQLRNRRKYVIIKI